MHDNRLTDLPPTPAQHFKLYCFAAVLHLLEQLTPTYGSVEAAVEQFPFLAGYQEELCHLACAAGSLADAIHDWEKTVSGHLPLRALRVAADLDHAALTLLITTGLIEEDARFGLLFESLQGMPGQHRPTVGLLTAWWRDANDCSLVRTTLRRLQELGLVQVINPDAPRVEWVVQPPAALWDALRGEVHESPAAGLRYQAPCQLLAVEQYIVPETIRHALAAFPALVSTGEVQALIVRGPQHNGRLTALGAVARLLNRGLLDVRGLSRADDGRWQLLGPLATLLHALPVVVLEPLMGETAHVPALPSYDGPLGLVLGRQGGVSGPAVERALTVTVDMPDKELRRQHWLWALDVQSGRDLEAISERCRMTAGNIRRAARMAKAQAALAGRTAVTLPDVQEARRALNRQALDTLAALVRPFGDWSRLVVGPETLRDLRSLENRCRHRENLCNAVGTALGSQLNAGVRALFSGPSGTGKTLAARLLAASLHMDLYRLDLSAVVNKYIGETEKNLNQIFARAEELDVILLLDEGDALLTRRTNVQTSNDRYANLETNYLLQRLETYEGILLVTTNAADRIDSAFQRRLEVVVDFRMPEASERWAIWQMHLPVEHAVEPSLLREVATRCTVTGGQIRNAVLHASLLALENGGMITSDYLEEAVQREYRKAGAVCPLRRTATAIGTRR
jgi:hypothetical protein